MKAIITVLGKDQTGIIAGVSKELSDSEVNILDISQTIMQQYFTMVMLVNLEKMTIDFETLREKLNNKSKELGVDIKIQREELFNSMHVI